MAHITLCQCDQQVHMESSPHIFTGAHSPDIGHKLFQVVCAIIIVCIRKSSLIWAINKKAIPCSIIFFS